MSYASSAANITAPNYVRLGINADNTIVALDNFGTLPQVGTDPVPEPGTLFLLGTGLTTPTAF